MLDKKNINLLLLAVLIAGATYRFCLVTWNFFPPGADIGLHESVINSILGPKTTFFYNYYHMGGGISVTNPGYHIFAAFIISMTGAPGYLVQAAVATLFSSLIIMAAFLIVKRVWGPAPALIVSVLVAFSASDVLMLSWAGYPNIVALTLIPLLFYTFLQPEEYNLQGYLVTTALLSGALFLTHLFSGIIFLCISLLAILVSIASSKTTGFTIKKALRWLIPVFVGFILVSPYIFTVLPYYFGSQGAITGSVPVMKQAIVETRLVSTIIMGLAIVPIVLFLVFSKRQTGKFLTLPSVLFACSILVPLVAAQSYLFGVFLDYERFLYFLSLPVVICLGLIVVRASNIITKALGRLKPASAPKSSKVLMITLTAICLLTPLFTLPNVGISQVAYFQVMDSKEYEAINWVKANVPLNSICVADAEFGWWLSGFAQRPVYSAVEPQFLILQREFTPAQIASNLLRADYIADNGILQIEQAGIAANGSAHDIYGVSNSSFVKPLVFSLNDTKISLLYRYNSSPKELTLGTFADSTTQVVNDGNSTSFIISRANNQVRITEEITIYEGLRFAKVTFVFQNDGSSRFDWLHVPFQAKGFSVQYGDSIGIVDELRQVITQLVFPTANLGSDVTMQETSDTYQLVFDLKGENNAQASFYVGLCPFKAQTEPPQRNNWKGIVENNSKTYLDVVSDSPINCFDYQATLRQNHIGYIVLRGSEITSRFTDDPTYKEVYNNGEAAVYEIVKL
jgi:hypothetical protein